MINITDSKSSTVKKNLQSDLTNNNYSKSQPLQEINLNSLNETPLFHNYTFSNVTFNIIQK